MEGKARLECGGGAVGKLGGVELCAGEFVGLMQVANCVFGLL